MSKPSVLGAALIALAGFLPQAVGQCIADETINTQFAEIISGNTSQTYEVAEGSCCQWEICSIPCPEQVSAPDKGKPSIRLHSCEYH